MSYTLPSNGSHFISLQQAIDMTSLYRSNRETILTTNYQNQNILALSETFNKADIETLLAKTGSAGLRCYYGMDESLKVHAIIVAVNSDGEDMLPSGQNALTATGDIVEEGQRCPDICPSASPLNT
ncbi:MAG: hypothetical protein HY252_16685 [Sphingobacteriales bacterium]|nr:hypothetical protein [Sphingobacteriales bacterium]